MRARDGDGGKTGGLCGLRGIGGADSAPSAAGSPGWGVSLGAGAIVLLAALPALSALVRGIASLSAMSGLDDSFMQQLLKIAGLSLLLDFAAQTCRDAQEEALALKVEFTGRVLLLSSALPVLQALLSQLVSLPLS